MFGLTNIMTKDVAITIKEHSTQAIRELTTILDEIKGQCPENEFMVVERGVGLTIGRIQMEILEYVNHNYPELDDLKDI